MPSTNARARAPRLTLATSVLLLMSCGSEQNRAQARSRELARADARSVSPQARSAARTVGRDDVRIVVDGSMSMAGFVGCGQQPTQFDVVLDRLMTELRVTSVSVFGEGGRGGPTEASGRPLHCPELYNRRQNADYKLYAQIAADSQGPAAQLYLTDGVQSDLGGNSQSPSVDQLARWLDEGRALAILAFRSRFEGPIWSEMRNRFIDTAVVERRPFYVFAFARSDEALDRALGTLSQATMDSARVVRFARSAVACALTPDSVRAFTKDVAIPWVMLSQPTTASAASGAVRVMDHACEVGPEFPLASVRPIVRVAKYLRWTGSDFVEDALPRGTEFRAAGTGRDGRARIEARLPMPTTPTRFGLFHLRVGAEAGAVRDWIDALSADSDADISAHERTYRFAWLVERLARVQLSYAVPADAFSITSFYR